MGGENTLLWTAGCLMLRLEIQEIKAAGKDLFKPG